MATTDQQQITEEMARRRAENLAGLLWHVGVYVIINAFFVALTATASTGADWPVVVTLAWGLAVAFHALWYLIAGRGGATRSTR